MNRFIFLLVITFLSVMSLWANTAPVIDKTNIPSWQTVGTASFSAGSASSTSIAFDSSNTPYVVYKDGGNASKATVMKYNGSSWVNVGTAGFSAGDVFYTSIAIDNNDTPYVVYEDGDLFKATVMKYDGSSWVTVGTAGFSTGDVSYTSIAIDSNNTPYVVYKDFGNSAKATVMKYNGSSWITVGTAGFSAGSASSTSIAFDSSNTPYVVYKDGGNSSKATVMKYNGSSWINVGNAGFSAGSVSDTSIAIDSNNNPYVVYQDAGNSYKATVKKFDGSSWVTVENAGFSAGDASYTSIAIDSNNNPYVVYKDGNNYKATVMKYNGSAWVDVGTAGFSAEYVYDTSIAIDSNNNPYVVYNDYGSGYKASVMKFDPKIYTPENKIDIIDINATDADNNSLTYFINGGDDSGLFDIDSTTGVLSFKNAPDYENPTDTNKDNIYNIEVSVNDGYNAIDTVTFSVEITNIADTPVVAPSRVHYKDTYNHVLKLSDNTNFDNVTWALKSGTILPSWLNFKDNYEISTLVETTGINDPASLAVDKYGNIYIAGRSDSSISKIIAGTDKVINIASSLGGTIRGIAIDSIGNIYALDQSSNNKIIKITPNGTQSDFATGFNSAYQMAIDSKDNIYVADRLNNKVVKVTSIGIKSDFAIGLNSVKGIAIDKYDNIITVNDSDNKDINKITPDGVVTKIGEFGSDKSIYSIGVDDEGNVFIPWYHGNNVMKISHGVVSEVSADDFGGAYGAAYDRLNHRMIVSTNTLDKIKVIDLPYKLVGNLTDEEIGTYDIKLEFTNGDLTKAYDFSIEVYNTAPTFETTPVTTIAKNTPYSYTIKTKDSDFQKVNLSATSLPSWLSLKTKYNFGLLDIYSGYVIGGMTSDKQGNIYYAGLDAIIKCAPDGTSTILAEGFSRVRSIDVDSAGNIFALDEDTGKLYRITPNGNVTLHATTVTSAYDMAVDNYDNILIADRTNNKVIRITPDGTVNNSYISKTYFEDIRGIAVDGDNNIYVANFAGKVFKFTENSDGSIGATTFADFTNIADFRIYNIDVDKATGDVYVPDYGHKTIHKIDANKNKTVFLEQSDADIYASYGVYFDNTKNRLLISQWSNKSIIEVKLNENIAVLSGTPSNANVGENSITLNASDGLSTTPQTFTLTVTDPTPTVTSDDVTKVYVDDGYSYTLSASDVDNDNLTWKIKDGTTLPSWLSFDSTATMVSTIAGSGSRGSIDAQGTNASFYYPTNVAVDSSGNIYVADTDNHKIRKINTSGNVTTIAGSGTSGSIDAQGTNASFNYPSGVSVDSSGNIYVADRDNHKIRKIDTSGNVTTVAGSGSEGSTDAQGTNASFYFPYAVAVDSSGNIYVADTNNHKIRKIDTNGNVTTLAGSGSIGSDDGQGTNASFNAPVHIAVDSTGNIYVADVNNHSIRKIDKNGYVTTLAGSGTSGSTDAQGTNASFNRPKGVAVDGSGNIYVSDGDNNKIRKIDASGNVTTIAGTGSRGSTDGQGTNASFNNPLGLAVDSSGNVYVPDYFNHKIRKISPTTKLTGNPTASNVGNHNISLILSDGVNEVEHNFTIEVAYLNHAPTDITLTGSLDENAPVDTTIGTLNTVDGDSAWDSYTYSFCESEGFLTLDGNTLKSKKVFDFEVENSYQTCIKTVDSKGETLEKNVSIPINNLNDNTPIITSDERTSVYADSEYSYTLLGNDLDGGNLTWKVKDGTTLPDWLSLSSEAKWKNVGDISTVGSNYTSIAIDSSNTPYVVYQDGVNSSRATVMKYNGSSWVNVGDAGFSAGKVYYISIAIDSSDTPYVVYQDGGNFSKATVMKYDGSSWVNVGSAGFSAGSTINTSIVFDSSDTPYVVYTDVRNSTRATVMKYDGSSWVNVGDAGFSAGTAYYTSIAFDSSDTPYVIYRDGGNSSKATVMKYNGSNWINVGNEGFSAGITEYNSIAFDRNNTPYVIYTDGGNSSKATVMKYNGSSWVNVGSAGFSAGTTEYTSIAFDRNNTPYVIYTDGGNSSKATVMKYDGISWVNVGDAGFSAGATKYTSIAFDSSNTPYVVYQDRKNSYKATVMKFDNTTKLTGTPTSSNIGEYPISLILTDGEKEVEHTFTITVNRVNTTPTNITISNNSINENAIPGATVGTLSTIDEDSAFDSYTYSFCGGNDDSDFRILGSSLTSNAMFDYEDKSSYSICVRTTDSENKTFDKTFTININNLNDNKPSVTSTALTSVNEGASYSYSFAASDIDGDNLTWSVKDGTTLPSWLSITQSETIQTVGTKAFSQGTADNISMVLDTKNTPYIVYDDGEDNQKVTVMKFDGVTWKTLGGDFITDDNSHYPSMAIDNNDTPYVVFSGGENRLLSVKKYNGTSWEYVGDSGISTDSVDKSSIAIDSSGTPYVAYVDTNNDDKTVVKKFNGTSWETVGEAVGQTAGTDEPKIAFDNNGYLNLAYLDISDNHRLQVQTYYPDGNVWQSYGSAISDSFASDLSFVSNGNNVYIAYIENYKSKVKRLVGGIWSEVNNLSLAYTQSNTSVYDHSLAINPTTGNPELFFASYNNQGKALYYTGSSWEYTINSDISDGSIYNLAMAIDSDGKRYFGFEEQVGYKATVMTLGLTTKLKGTPKSTDVGDHDISLVLSDGTNEVEHNFTITVNRVNHAPENVTISINSLPEDAEINTQIGTLNTVDGDNDWDSYTYSFCGGTDDDGFLIEGNILKSNTPFDYETKTSYSICVKTTDSQNKTLDKTLTIKVINVNDNKPSVKSTAITSVNEKEDYVYTLLGKDLDNDTLKWSVKAGESLPGWLTLGTSTKWENVGEAGFSTFSANYTSIAIDSNNTPYVVYSDTYESYKATVKKFNGSTWESVGNTGFSTGKVGFTSIAFDSSDTPYVVYQDRGNSYKTTVMKFDGTSWIAVGEVAFSAGDVNYTSIVFDSNDTPYVVYQDGGNSYKATVMKFNETSWVTVGDAGFSAGSADYTSIVFDSNNTPYVVYKDMGNSSKATVMKYDGTSWVTVGDAGFSAGSADYTSIAFDSSDTPYVVYQDYENSYKATVMKYNGTSWVTVGDAGFSAGSASYASIAFDSSNTPYVVYQDGGNSSKATVMKYDGSSWVNVGNAGFSAGQTMFISVAFDSNDKLYVVYQDGENSSKATVMKFDNAMKLTGTPTSADIGAHDVKLILSDGANEVAHNFTITVKNVNDKPSITSEPITTINEDSLYTYNLTASDLDSDPLTWSVKVGTNLPSWLSLSGSKLTGTPTNDDVGEHNISLVLSDGTANVSHDFTITVKNVNDAPTSANFNVNLNEDSSYEFKKSLFTFTDVDSESMSKIKIITIPSKGTLKSGNTPISVNDEISAADISNIVYEPASNEFGSSYTSFTYKISDGTDYSVDAYTVTLNVAAINDAPTISSTTNETKAEDFEAFTKNFTIADVDGDDLTISVENNNTDLLTTSMNLTNPIASSTYGSNPAILTVNSVANKFGKAKITVTVKDASSSNSSSFDIEVPAVLDFPNISSEKVEASEDFGTYDIKLTGIDLAGQSSATIDITVADTNVVDVVASSITTSTTEATFTLKSVQDAVGNTKVTVKVTAGTQVVSKDIDVSIKAVNDAPTITNIPSSASENTSYSWTPTVVDVDNTSHTFKATSLPTWASINETTGVISGTPSYDDAGSTAIKVIISDGELSNEYEFNLVVQNTNRAPTLLELSNTSIKENDTEVIGTFIPTDSDANDNHSYTFCGGTDDTSFTIVDNQIKTSGILDYETQSSYAICVRVNDGTDNLDTNFTITLTDLNDIAPSATLTSLTIDEDTSKTFVKGDFGFSDEDTDSVFESLTITAIPTKGSLKLDGVDVLVNQEITSDDLAKLVFAPIANENADSYDSFKYKVSDGVNISSEYTVSINVTAVDDAPVLDIINDVSTNEDTNAQVSFSASDVENDDISYSVTSSDTSIATVSIENGKIVVSPVENVTGIVEITLEATANSKTATQKFNLRIIGVNDAPTSANFSVTIDEDTSKTFAQSDFAFSDSDTNDELVSIVISALPSNGTLKLDTQSVTLNQVIDASDISKLVFAPALNANGTSYDVFNFKVNDGVANSVEYTTTINVTAVDDAPTISKINEVLTKEDTSAQVSFNANDIENDDISYSVNSSDTSIATVSIENGKIVVAPVTNKYGNVEITLEATANSKTATQKFKVTILAVNDAPTSADFSVTIDEDTSKTFAKTDFAFSDVDTNDELVSIVISTLPSNGTLYLGTNSVSLNDVISVSDISSLSFMPALNGNGNAYDTFKFKVNDGVENSVEYTTTINVTAVDDAPIIENIDTVFTNEDTSVQVSFSASDAENDTISYSVSSSDTSIATVSIVDGKIVVAPVLNKNGEVEITLQATANSKTSEQKFTVVISPVNDAPTSSDATIKVYEDSSYNFNENEFSFTDIDTNDELLSIKIISLPTKGILKLDGVEVKADDEIKISEIKKLSYAPIADEFGSDYSSFTFKVSDGTAYSSSENTITIDVEGVNDAPTISDTSDEKRDEDFGTFTKEFTIADLDSDDLSMTVVNTNTDLLTTSVDLTNPIASSTYRTTPVTLSVNSVANKFGKATITMKVSDATSSNFTTFDIEVPAVLDFPNITSEKVEVSEDFNTYDIKLTGIDLTGSDSATVDISVADTSIVDVVSSSISTETSEATFTLKSVQNATGDTTADIKVTVGDQEVTKTISISVKPVNDAPKITNTPTTAVEAVAYSWTPTIEDVDNQSADFTFSIQRLPSWASFDTSTGEISGTPSLSDAKTYENIELTVSDGNLSHTITTSIVVENTNQAPVINTNSSVEVKENTTDVVTIDAIDLDEGDEITFAINGGDDASMFSIDYNTGKLVFKTAPNFEDAKDTDTNNSYLVNIDVSDGALTTTLNLIVNIVNVNENPTDITLSSSSIVENSSSAFITIDTGDVDVDDIHTYSFCGGSDDEVFKISGDKLMPKVALNYESINTYSVCIKTQDIKGISLEKTFSINVTNVDEAPVFNDLSDLNKDEDFESLNIPLNAKDEEGDTLSYKAISSDETIATVKIVDGKLVVTPIKNASGQIEITIEVSSNGQTTIKKFIIDITAINDAPVLIDSENKEIEKLEDKVVYKNFNNINISLKAIDPEGSDISYEIKALTEGIATLSFNETTKVLTIKSIENVSGKTDIEVKLSDGTNEKTYSFNLYIVPLEDGTDLEKIEDISYEHTNEGTITNVNISNDLTVKKTDNTDGTVEHEINVNGTILKAVSNIVGAVVELVENGVKTVYEDVTKNLQLEVDATLTGQAKHALTKNGKTTQAVSENKNASTIIDEDDNGNVQIITSVEVDTNTSIKVTANEDGTAVHEVSKSGKSTTANSKIIGAQTLITQLGNVETTAGEIDNTDYFIKAKVITDVEGKSVTKFVKVSKTDSSDVTDLESTLEDSNKFEIGNNIEISEISGNLYIKIIAPLGDTPMIIK